LLSQKQFQEHASQQLDQQMKSCIKLCLVLRTEDRNQGKKPKANNKVNKVAQREVMNYWFLKVLVVGVTYPCTA